MRVGSHPTTRMVRAKREFLAVAGVDAAIRRAHDISRRPSKVWKGTRVWQIQCTGTSGRGPHVQFVPAVILWVLIDPRLFRCPFHAHDLRTP